MISPPDYNPEQANLELLRFLERVMWSGEHVWAVVLHLNLRRESPDIKQGNDHTGNAWALPSDGHKSWLWDRKVKMIYGMSLAVRWISLSAISCVLLRVAGDKQQALLPVHHLDLSPVSLELISVPSHIPSSCPIFSCPTTWVFTLTIHCANNTRAPYPMDSPLSPQSMAGLTQAWGTVYFSSYILKET